MRIATLLHHLNLHLLDGNVIVLAFWDYIDLCSYALLFKDFLCIVKRTVLLPPSKNERPFLFIVHDHEEVLHPQIQSFLFTTAVKWSMCLHDVILRSIKGVPQVKELKCHVWKLRGEFGRNTRAKKTPKREFQQAESQNRDFYDFCIFLVGFLFLIELLITLIV